MLKKIILKQRKNHYHGFIFLSACMFLSACTTATTKSEIRAAQYQDHFSVLGNYQTITKCWDESAEKLSINHANATFITLYSDINQAEIAVNMGSYYYLLVDIKQDGKNTKISIYGNGSMGEIYLPKWKNTFLECSNKTVL
jgi:hypothetical protein